MKKFLSLAMTLVMAMSLATTAFATDLTLQSDMTGQGDMEIYGTVEPVQMIDVTLPLDGLKFTINADRTITWVDGTITSNSPAPLVVTMIEAGEATLEGAEVGTYNVNGAPALVADNAFADWNNLTKAQSKANIAISVNGENISTASDATPVALGEIASAYGEDGSGNFQANPQTLDVEGSALYGKSWDNASDLLFKYDTVLEFAMK